MEIMRIVVPNDEIENDGGGLWLLVFLMEVAMMGRLNLGMSSPCPQTWCVVEWAVRDMAHIALDVDLGMKKMTSHQKGGLDFGGNKGSMV